MVSNGTLGLSPAGAQPLKPWVPHLGPSVPGLGAHFKMFIWRPQTASRAVSAFPGGWLCTWILQQWTLEQTLKLSFGNSTVAWSGGTTQWSC